MTCMPCWLAVVPIHSLFYNNLFRLTKSPEQTIPPQDLQPAPFRKQVPWRQVHLNFPQPVV